MSSSSTWYKPSLIDHMLFRIQQCNHIPEHIENTFLNFSVEKKVLGRVTPKVADRLCSVSLTSSKPVFMLDETSTEPILTLTEAAGTTPESRTAAVASVMNVLRDSGYITGWRDEMYPVAECFDEVSSPVFLVERAAAALLGVLEYGVHINGLVKEDDGKTMMWMARRSKTKSNFPGMVDHIVAGGQPAGLSLMDNVLKECLEEAGIPPELTLKGVKPTGAISYANYVASKSKDEGEGVLSRVVLFNFDLKLPREFEPHANDGEVDYFFKWNLEEIADSMDPECDDPIKPNCYLVIIDWLMRSGAIAPDSPKYLEVLRKLRSGTCK